MKPTTLVFISTLALIGCGGPSTPATCNNGALDTGEMCDGIALGDQTCRTQGFDTGTLACASNCLGFDTSGCSGTCTAMCGTRVCGADPVCGISCGTCSDAKTECSPEGTCVPSCELDAWTSNVALPLDLDEYPVSGAVTLNGQAFPEATGGQRSRLGFKNKVSGDTKWLDLPKTGAASYSVNLWKGTYDVVVSSRAGDGTGIMGSTSTSGDANLDAVVVSNLEVTGPTTKDLALATAHVSGAVSLNGGAYPDATGSARVNLGFRNKGTGDTLWTTVPKSGAATYSTTLWQGTYDVIASSLLDDGTAITTSTSTDELDAVVETGDAFTTAAVTKDLALTTVAISGAVTLNGGAFPAATGTLRTRILFKNQSSGDTKSFDLPKTGAAAYAVTVWKGTYDIVASSLTGDGTNVTGTTTDAVDQHLDVVAQKGLAANASMTADLALSTVQVSGTVTLNGAAYPAATDASRAHLGFRNKSSADTVWLDLPKSGAATYSITLWQGTYDVIASSRLGDGTSVSTSISSGADNLDAIVVTGAAFTSVLATKDIPLATAPVTGTVTLNGQAFPAATGAQRTRIGFKNEMSGDTKWFDLSQTGAASYALNLWQGTYDIVASSRTDDGTGIGASTMDLVDLNLDTVVEKSVAVNGATPKDIALATMSLSGTATLNGASFPSATSTTRTHLGFRNKSSGDTLWFDLPASGAAAFATTLWQGTYDVIASSRIGDGTPISTTLPDSSGDNLDTVVLRGCGMTSASSMSKADWSGTWVLMPDDGSMLEFDLTQAGVSLSGTATFRGFTGPLSGSRSDDHFDVIATFNGADFPFTGSVDASGFVTGQIGPNINGIVPAFTGQIQ